tara:strand:- start:15525 stop:16847 length:1323 start_codon:yes stop_codon:yes gene_type:complete
MNASTRHYTVVAIALHWAIAASILGNLIIGWWMHGALDDPAMRARAVAAYQLHKSIGLTTLVLSVARLAWRIANPPPPLPDTMPAWERRAAHATHWFLYFLMIAIPLTGWIYVSTGWSAPQERALEVPTIFFGLFQVPHLFGLNEMSDSMRQFAAEMALESHELLAFATVGLFFLHVTAALKHHFFNHDAVLAQMIPWLTTRNTSPAPVGSRRSMTLILSFALILAAIAATAIQIFNIPATQADASSVAANPSLPEIPQQAIAEEPPPTSAIDADIPEWKVDYANSSIAFTGVHVGTPFRGSFSRWSADIRFDPDKLSSSQAIVVIETASASDGVTMHDNSLPGAEWFDVTRHPTATFRTGRIARTPDGYLAKGTLTIKGRAIPLDFPFTLTIENDRAKLLGHARIDRAKADLGMESDPQADYVSQEIGIEVSVSANHVK